MAAVVHCTHCSTPLEAGPFSKGYAPCPQCLLPLRVYPYPALVRDTVSGRSGERVTSAGESACFYHPEKRAAVVCEGCGRFLCSLCDVEMSGRHLCPACLEAGRGLEQEKVERTRYLHEELAFSAALLSVILWFLAIPIGLYAVYVAVRHWKEPGRFGTSGKLKKVLAILVGAGAALGWGAFFAVIFTAGSG